MFGIFRDGGHRGADLATERRTRDTEILAHHGRELERKHQLLNLQGRTRQAIDGVIGHRPGRMTALVGDFEREHLVDLFSGLDLQHEMLLPVGGEQAACTLIDGERRVDELALVLQQVVHAVHAVGSLLAAGERHDEVALRLETALALQTQHEIEEHRGHRLVVGGTAAKKETVFLDELERIALPVGALRIHDVDVCEQQHRLLFCAGRPDANDNIAVVRFSFGNHHLHVVGRESRSSSRVSAVRTTFVQDPVEGDESISTISR